jgi:hypothetical protein
MVAVPAGGRRASIARAWTSNLSTINNMLKVSSWNDGLLASPVGWNHFGQAQQTSCEYFTKVEGDKFVTINNGKPFCGTLIPNSDVAP